MSQKTTPPAGPGFADPEFLAFAKALFAAAPAGALSALRHMTADGASSLKELGATPQMLNQLCLRAAIGGRDDWEAVEELARSVIRGGDEGLNLAMASSVAAAVEGSASTRSKWERAPSVELDFMDAQSLMSRPAPIARAWVECPALRLSHEDAIQALERQPEHFEGAFGVERVKDALAECGQARERGGFWMRAGPNALQGALERSIEDQADERLMDACRELSEMIGEGAGADEERAQERLSALAGALAKSALARRSPGEALAFLGEMALHQSFGAVESFAREADWASEAPSLAELGPNGLPAPHPRYIRHITPHPLIKQSEAGEAPLGLCELALLWDEPRLEAIGRALGETGEQAQRVAETLERYASAQELAETDPQAGEALAQSAELLWQSHKGSEMAPARPSPRV